MVRWSVRCYRCHSWYSGVGNTPAPYKNIQFVKCGNTYRPACIEYISCRIRVRHKIEPYQLEIYPKRFRHDNIEDSTEDESGGLNGIP